MFVWPFARHSRTFTRTTTGIFHPRRLNNTQFEHTFEQSPLACQHATRANETQVPIEETRRRQRRPKPSWTDHIFSTHLFCETGLPLASPRPPDRSRSSLTCAAGGLLPFPPPSAFALCGAAPTPAAAVSPPPAPLLFRPPTGDGDVFVSPRATLSTLAAASTAAADSLLPCPGPLSATGTPATPFLSAASGSIAASPVPPAPPSAFGSTPTSPSGDRCC